MRTQRLIIFGLLVLVVSLGAVLLNQIPHLSAASTGSTPNPAIPNVSPPPRGPTVHPATAGPNGTAIPTGVYRTSPNGSPVAQPFGPSSPLQGLPAIKPTIATTDASTAAFLAQDAIAYVSAHDVGGKITAAGAITVADVQFITAKAAGIQLGSPLPLDDSRLICLVKVTGNFTVSAPAGGKSAALGVTYEIFDAQTGNSLMTIA